MVDGNRSGRHRCRECRQRVRREEAVPLVRAQCNFTSVTVATQSPDSATGCSELRLRQGAPHRPVSPPQPRARSVRNELSGGGNERTTRQVVIKVSTRWVTVRLSHPGSGPRARLWASSRAEGRSRGSSGRCRGARAAAPASRRAGRALGRPRDRARRCTWSGKEASRYLRYAWAGCVVGSVAGSVARRPAGWSRARGRGVGVGAGGAIYLPTYLYLPLSTYLSI